MILVIDDTPGLADGIAHTLRAAGREAVIAATVDDAMRALASTTPLCVVLDLRLDAPADALHGALVARQIPVLLVSAVEQSRLPEVAAANGWRYLAKPFEVDALIGAVNDIVEHATGRYSVIPSSITRGADGSVTATKSTASVISETVVDLGALAILGAVLLVVRPENAWIQGGCIVGLLLLAGVRVADLVAVAKGLPGRGGPASVVLALLGAGISRIGGSS